MHASHFVATWTTALPVDQLGRLFEDDLGNLPDNLAEAAFAAGDDAYHIEPSDLSRVLVEGVAEVDWFRVNLESESFVWMRSDPRSPYGLFGVISDQYDSRLLLALITKTATALTRASTRSMLRVLGDVYRAPGIGIRRPSMMNHFTLLSEDNGPWT